MADQHHSKHHPVLTIAQEHSRLKLTNNWRKADSVGIAPKMLDKLIALRVAVSRDFNGVPCVSLVQLDLFESE